MKRNFNFNYAFLFYDVNEKRVNKIFKICKKYFHHHQNSVFRGEITPANLIKLRSELNAVVKEKDFVTIIKLINGSCFDEETLGIREKNTENLIL